MRHPTTSTMRRTRNNHISLYVVSSREKSRSASRHAITNNHQSNNYSRQRRLTKLKTMIASKKKNADKSSRPTPPDPHPYPLLFVSSLMKDTDCSKDNERTKLDCNKNNKSEQQITRSSWNILKRRGMTSPSSGENLKRGGGAKNKTKPKNGKLRSLRRKFNVRKDADDRTAEIGDTDSDGSITENGVLTRFFGGDEDTSSGSLETLSQVAGELDDDDDDGRFWYSLQSICGNCA